MRLLIYTAAIAVMFFAIGVRLETHTHYPAAEHDAELGTRIELLETYVRELSCIHEIFEDGSAAHHDAEFAYECLYPK